MQAHSRDPIAGGAVLVTGANGAIGAALVEGFRAAGAAQVVATARTVPQTAQPGVTWEALDLTDAAAIDRIGQTWADRVDVLVNNAGVNGNATFLDPSDSATAREEMEVNYFGSLNLVRAIAPAMMRRRRGTIVNVLSTTCFSNLPIMGSYSASKAAMWSLTQGLRAELAPSGITVVGVFPSIVASRLTEHLVNVPKLAPEAVARGLIDGLRAASGDIFLGSSADLYRRIREDPLLVEQQQAARLHASRRVE